MPCRASFLAVGPALLVAAAVATGEPLYDRTAGHPWDQVRDIFYVRQFSTGEVFEHRHAFAPPWHGFSPFTREGAFYEQVLSRLEAVEKLPPNQMEEQPASRRLIFLRDLWPVFDGLHLARGRSPLNEAASAEAAARCDELLRRVARVMQRLELTAEEVRALPDAFQTIVEKQPYPRTFDPSSGSEPFFPTDLFDKDGPWVAYSSEPEPSAGGVLHMNFVDHRSVFTLHLRSPDGRDGGVKLLHDFTKTERQQIVPPGTTLALLRRALVPTRSGRLLVSPLVESLQLIVAAPLEDHRFKFTLDRKEFLAGQIGLRLLGEDDPVDHSSFESVALWPHPAEPRTYDADGELMIMTKYKTLREMPGSLATCVKCHDDAWGTFLYGGSGPRKAYLQSSPDEADAAVVKNKEASQQWQSYLRLRAAQDN